MILFLIKNEITFKKSIEENKMEKISFDELIETFPMFFPNPFSNELYVKYELKGNTKVTVDLYSKLGKLVYTKDFYGIAGRNISKLDLETNESFLIAKICYNNVCRTTKLIKNEK